MKRFTIVSLVTFLGLIILSSNSFAQIGLKFGPRVGTETKDGYTFAGAQLEAKVLMITLAPNVEYFFKKNAKRYDLNLDGQYTVIGVGVAKLFAGAGYAMSFNKPDHASSSTNKGFNVQFGGKVNLAGFEVFALAKYMRIDGANDKALLAGMNFSLF